VRVAGASHAAAAVGLSLLLHAAGAAAQAAEYSPSRPSRSAPRVWSLELYGGSAASVPTPLRIRQAGMPDVTFTAHYATRPFRDSPYYMYRAGRWKTSTRRGWEVELLHHKLYLRNAPPEVEHFEVTHGFNMLFVNRAQSRRPGVVRFGLGVVVAHPEATVRGRVLAGNRGLLRDGYYLAGPAAQAAVARRVTLGRTPLFVGVEAKGTAAYARVPIADGHASVPNLAAHLLLGVGAEF